MINFAADCAERSGTPWAAALIAVAGLAAMVAVVWLGIRR